MTAKDIVETSSPAIVRIEAGDNKVGTGFIVDKTGLIATNLHVIAGETDIKVRLYKDPTEYQVMSVAGVDKGHDLALVRIAPKHQLSTVKLGDSSVVSAGDQVVAIGNPLGVFDYSVSAGLISQVRPLSSELTILQISAPISQGSSGGPLFNQFGEVIGVTTAIITSGQNINLAVPGNYLRPMMAQKEAIKLDEFAKATKENEPEADEDHTQIIRKVPLHPVSVWDGCNPPDIEEVVKAISDAISIGAPLYNQGLKDPGINGFEGCYRVYEGAALRWEREAHCKGVGSAFGDGLLRASSMSSYQEKAWAMRDTFDGLLCVAETWCKKNTAKCSQELKQLHIEHCPH